MWTSNETRRMRLMARLAVAGRSSPGAVLDIGCAARPNRFLRGAPLVGLDLEPGVAAPPYDERIAGDAGDLAAVLQGPAAGRPTAARGFDAIVAGEVIEHIEDPYRFLRACRGALRPGGRLVLSTPNPLHPPVLLAEALGTRRLFYTGEHKHYFLPRWVRRMLEHSGLRLVSRHGVGFPLLVGPRPVLPSPALLSYQIVYVAEADPRAAAG